MYNIKKEFLTLEKDGSWHRLIFQVRSKRLPASLSQLSTYIFLSFSLSLSIRSERYCIEAEVSKSLSCARASTAKGSKKFYANGARSIEKTPIQFIK